DAASLCLPIVNRALPLLFIRNQRPILFAMRRELKLVGLRVGEVNAPFAGGPEPVAGTKVALRGASQLWNQIDDAVEVFLAYVQRDVDGPAVPLGAIGQRGNRTNADHLVIGKLEEGFALVFA